MCGDSGEARGFLDLEPLAAVAAPIRVRVTSKIDLRPTLQAGHVQPDDRALHSGGVYFSALENKLTARKPGRTCLPVRACYR